MSWMTPDTVYPDLELGLVDWLVDNFPELAPPSPDERYRHAGDELPAQWRGRLPFVEVQVGEGPSDGLTWYPDVEINVYSDERRGALNLARQVFARLSKYPWHFAEVVADTVEVTAMPRRMRNLEPSEGIFAFGGEAIISLRR